MKLAFVFSGQGSQYAGMGQDLYEKYQLIKKRFDQADLIFEDSLTNIMFTDDKKLSKTLYAQPAIFTMSAAIRDLLNAHGIFSDGACGLSLGEYAAYYDQNMFDFEVGLRTIIHRAYYMEDATAKEATSMVALLGSLDQVEALVKTIDDAYIANYNNALQFVVGGSQKAMQTVIHKARDAGIKRAVMLDTSGAFHTPYMASAAIGFAEYLKYIEVKPEAKALYLNTTGDLFKGDLKKEMQAQITSPVLFDTMIQAMIRDGFDCFVEIGPKDTLKRLIKKIDKQVKVFNIDSVDTFETFVEAYKEMA